MLSLVVSLMRENRSSQSCRDRGHAVRPEGRLFPEPPPPPGQTRSPRPPHPPVHLEKACSQEPLSSASLPGLPTHQGWSPTAHVLLVPSLSAGTGVHHAPAHWCSPRPDQGRTDQLRFGDPARTTSPSNPPREGVSPAGTVPASLSHGCDCGWPCPRPGPSHSSPFPDGGPSLFGCAGLPAPPALPPDLLWFIFLPGSLLSWGLGRATLPVLPLPGPTPPAWPRVPAG